MVFSMKAKKALLHIHIAWCHRSKAAVLEAQKEVVKAKKAVLKAQKEMLQAKSALLKAKMRKVDRVVAHTPVSAALPQTPVGAAPLLP